MPDCHRLLHLQAPITPVAPPTLIATHWHRKVHTHRPPPILLFGAGRACRGPLGARVQPNACQMRPHRFHHAFGATLWGA